MTTPTFFFLRKTYLISFSQTNSKIFDANCATFFFSLARDHSDTPYAYFWLSTALNPLPLIGRPIIATPEEI